MPPSYNLEGKKVQNLVQFTTTFDFDHEYLWNR